MQSPLGNRMEPPRNQPGLPMSMLPAPAEKQKADIDNFKSALNEIVMKIKKQPLKTGDITYTSSLMTVSGGTPMYNAAVRIAVLDGKTFDGQPQALRKDAEQSAAQMAVQQLTAPGGVLPRDSKTPIMGQRKRAQGPKLPNYKGRLQELLVQDQMKARIFGAPASASVPVEISYATVIRPPDPARQFVGTEFCATVRISGNGKQVEFHGGMCKERKTAEQSAAHVALQHFLEHDSTPNVVSVQSSAVVSQAAAAKPSAKSELNELVMKILARPSTPQDIVYDMKQKSPFKVVVSVPSLQVDRTFEGEVLPLKKSAEQSAAQMALDYFRSLPQMPRASGASAAPAAPGGRNIPATGLADIGAAASLTRPADLVASVAALQNSMGSAVDSKNANHKSALNEFVMKLVGRPLTSGDITYTIKSMRPGQYQATAKIPVIDDMEFAAAPRNRKRDAEHCAAQIALLYYQAKYPGGGVPLAEDGSAANADSVSVNVSQNYKSLLNEMTMRVAGRPLQTGDITYVVRAMSTFQFQATVKVHVIDAQLDFKGDVCSRKKDAEQSAAAKALDHFSNNPPAPRSQPASAPPPVAAAQGSGSNAADRTLASTDVGNFKSALNELVMRSSGHPLSRADISYFSKPLGNGQFFTQVTVPALDGQKEFAGEPRSRKRDAEQAAAKVALLHFQSVSTTAPVENLPASAP